MPRDAGEQTVNEGLGPAIRQVVLALFVAAVVEGLGVALGLHESQQAP
jgi:hypothetical protein